MHYNYALMRVFLDTNVIIDLIQRRVGYDDAALIMQKAENGEYSLFTSSLSMVNVAYILRKYYKGENLYHLLEELGDIIDVITVSSEAYHQALQSRASDFEDAVQLFSAIESEMDCIVTRNAQDFLSGKLPIYTPIDFLNR